MKSTKKLTHIALFLALVCISTMIIKIPIPAVNGYLHFGDAFVILCGVFLGPVSGALAAGFGSALADILSGYAIYALPTLLIKAIVAGGIGCFYSKLWKNKRHVLRNYILCGIYTSGIVVIGYFIFERILYGNVAFVSIPANFVQGIFGTIISAILMPFLNKIRNYDVI